MSDIRSKVDRRAMLKASAAGGFALAVAGHGTAMAKSPRQATEGSLMRDILFDSDWRFHLGDLPGAERPAFDDRNWRALSLPHDWSIEDRPGAPKQADGWVPPVALWNPGPHPKDAKPVSPEVPIVMASVHPTVPGGPPRKVGRCTAGPSTNTRMWNSAGTSEWAGSRPTIPAGPGPGYTGDCAIPTARIFPAIRSESITPVRHPVTAGRRAPTGGSGNRCAGRRIARRRLRSPRRPPNPSRCR